jgi:hypothetical protein
MEAVLALNSKTRPGSGKGFNCKSYSKASWKEWDGRTEGTWKERERKGRARGRGECDPMLE